MAGNKFSSNNCRIFEKVRCSCGSYFAHLEQSSSRNQSQCLVMVGEGDETQDTFVNTEQSVA